MRSKTRRAWNMARPTGFGFKVLEVLGFGLGTSQANVRATIKENSASLLIPLSLLLAATAT